MRRVVVKDWQKFERQDADNMSLFPQQYVDHVVNDFLADGFAGFNIAAPIGSTEIRVGAGELYVNGIGYFNDDEGGVPFDLITMLPTVTRRVVAVCAWGHEVAADTEPRTFLTNATTRATVARQESTELRRRAEVSLYRGDEGPDPNLPAVPGNVTVIAYITLDVGGVVFVDYVDENRVPNLREHHTRLADFEAWRTQAGTRLDTLGTDLAALAGRLNGTAGLELVVRLASEMADVREELGLPDDYTFWSADHFLDDDESDTGHIDYLARVEEGVRFPPVQTRVAQMNLANPLDESVVVTNNFAIPAYTEVSRVSNLVNTREFAISQNAHQTLNWQQFRRVRWRLRYGHTFARPMGWINWFRRHPDEKNWEIKNGRVWIFRNGETSWPIRQEDFQAMYRAARHEGYWDDRWQRSYWTRFRRYGVLNGATFAQTFLNSQAGWLTSVDLMFTRKAAAGNVTVLILETNENGQPNMDAVIAEATLPVGSIVIGGAHTRIPFEPTFLEAGQRYAIQVATAGNHFVGVTGKSAFAQGTFFVSTDGAWMEADLQMDLAFRVNFARFRRGRAVVQLAPLELAGGIAAIDILQEAIVPEGTRAVYQVQLNGRWRSIDPDDIDPDTALVGLPPLLNFRVVLIGTQDLMPGFGLGPLSEVETWRPRNDFTHISKTRTLQSNVNTVHIDVRVEGWREQDPAIMGLTCELLVGAGFETVEQPDVTTIERDKTETRGRWFRYTFNLATPRNAYKIRIKGTNENPVRPFNVSERRDVAFTV